MDLAYMNVIPKEEFIQRRAKLLAQMEDNSSAVIFSSKEQFRNSHCTYPFRQDSYFWYLTGFNEPESVLVLSKKNQQISTALFLRPSDPERETWDGRRLGIEKAPQALQIDQAFNISELKQQLPTLLFEAKTVYFLQGLDGRSADDEFMQSLLPDLRAIAGRKYLAPQEFTPLQPILDEMRLFKSENEIRIMQQAGQISALAHIRAMKEARANRFEYEIESEMLHEFNRFGARYASYNSIIGGGENACILHYVENDQPLKDGDLLLIDAGCEFAMYAGDITRTFPINGKFSPAQREIYEIVLKAQKRALEILVAGNSIQQANDEVVRIKTEGLVRLGILKGDVEELIANQAYKEFYMHGLGHWLGLDVHDVGSYSNGSHNVDRNSKVRDRTLQPGMVLTVEPGLYISSKSDVPEQYKGIGVRIEDNILITETGNKIFTSAVPKEVDEIEALMAER
ncbi:Xaa-Pro aminopeptidase [Lonepinella koalarum]|uniref:Xaa-Pro aminopeptidase n=1 Tax=Lonepinella koalarum TaxID=53417 RepID=A0A4V6NEM3_9PAST|nr:Xaa-Pro aminopeptidase [Lonepinella koalarum]MDH2925709.1 Xaa-Pro aminopeptidase [Lonepinella koalarum]TCK67091.1 aminopeptidase P [Lonepinella koalarum]TFJ88918.1 Xaa-Pro aminopeptidase [Lonepinella koalarum]TYG34926.1 Xaa-Pro aminopeptidase [Lonepinella koalarum]